MGERKFGLSTGRRQKRREEKSRLIYLLGMFQDKFNLDNLKGCNPQLLHYNTMLLSHE